MTDSIQMVRDLFKHTDRISSRAAVTTLGALGLGRAEASRAVLDALNDGIVSLDSALHLELVRREELPSFTDFTSDPAENEPDPVGTEIGQMVAPLVALVEQCRSLVTGAMLDEIALDRVAELANQTLEALPGWLEAQRRDARQAGRLEAAVEISELPGWMTFELEQARMKGRMEAAGAFDFDTTCLRCAQILEAACRRDQNLESKGYRAAFEDMLEVLPEPGTDTAHVYRTRVLDVLTETLRKTMGATKADGDQHGS